MNQMNLKIDGDRRAFDPGESVSVQLNWELEKRVDEIRIRLVWFTRGRGDADFELIQEESVDSPQLTGSESFQFQLPGFPCSLQGELFSLIWAFEAELIPLKEIYRK